MPSSPLHLILVITVILLSQSLRCLAGSRPEDDRQGPNGQKIEKNPPIDSDAIWISELGLGGYRKVTKIDEPDRVYIKKSVRTGEAKFFITDDAGNLSGDPPTYFLADSVVLGRKLGCTGDEANDYFKLTVRKDAEGKTHVDWTRTTPPQYYSFQEDSEDGINYAEDFKKPEAKRHNGSSISGEPHIGQ
jgi:hypothetical protein